MGEVDLVVEFEKLASQPKVQQAAVANDADSFRMAAIGPEFQDGAIDQMGAAQDITTKFLDDPEFAQAFFEIYMPSPQTKAKVADREHCPIEVLFARSEDASTRAGSRSRRRSPR